MHFKIFPFRIILFLLLLLLLFFLLAILTPPLSRISHSYAVEFVSCCGRVKHMHHLKAEIVRPMHFITCWHLWHALCTWTAIKYSHTQGTHTDTSRSRMSDEGTPPFLCSARKRNKPKWNKLDNSSRAKTEANKKTSPIQIHNALTETTKIPVFYTAGERAGKRVREWDTTPLLFFLAFRPFVCDFLSFFRLWAIAFRFCCSFLLVQSLSLPFSSDGI